MKCLASVSYDGSKFYGFQRLNDDPSVQGELERVLTKINKKGVEVKGAGRTDRGVHALGQGVSFDLDIDITEEGNVKVTIEDTVIGREKEHELFDLLHNILCNRCHMDGSIFFDYKEPVKSKYLENAEREIEQRIASISANGDEVIGKVIDYNQGANVLLKVSGAKEFYIPLVDNYVINVDTKNREIHTKNGKDLIL